jgi:hypothetical protein
VAPVIRFRAVLFVGWLVLGVTSGLVLLVAGSTGYVAKVLWELRGLVGP